MRRATVLVTIAAALLFAGCGDGDGDSTATTGRRLDAEAVATRLKEAGLPIGEVRVYTAANDPNEQLGRPGGYTSKVSFHDTRLEQSDDFDVNGGGSVEVFDNEKDANSRFEYVDAIARGNAMFNEYHWLDGPIFLRVSKSLTPDQAEEYHRALQAMT